MKGKKVLLVDDTLSIRISTRQELNHEWYDVITANDWKEALELVWQFKDELLCIITDNAMPNMTWIQLAKEVRKTWNHINIIMISWDDPEKLKWQESWINYFLKKPFDIDELLYAIKK